MTAWLFDGLVAGGLLWLSWQVIASREPFSAVLLFIALGLLMALCWARLAAPDVALAEAAIGAGLTGALLLDACRTLQSNVPLDGPQDTAPERLGNKAAGPVSGLLALLCVTLVVGLAWTLLLLPAPPVDLAAQVRENLANSGVTNPVTAVLLNFRSYDTLLEVAVLLLALIGVCNVNAGEAGSPTVPTHIHDLPLLDSLIRVLVPVATLTGAYLLWAGAHSPGGAFQAGAVLAGVGVLLRLDDRVQPLLQAPLPWRTLTVLGLSVFGITALGTMAWSGNLLQFPRPWASVFILLVESCLTISIAVTLALLFSGAPALRRRWP